MLSNSDIGTTGTGHHERNPSAIPKTRKLEIFIHPSVVSEPPMPDGLFTRIYDSVEAEIRSGVEPDIRIILALHPDHPGQVFDTVNGAIENCLTDDFFVAEAGIEKGRCLPEMITPSKPHVREAVSESVDEVLIRKVKPQIPTS